MTVINRTHFTRRFGAGFTLVELMVAMTIGLFLIGAMLAVLSGSASTGKTKERASELQTNGRYALDFMRREIQHAGFLGITSLFFPDAPVSFNVTNVCDTGTVGKLSLRIWGSNDSNPYAATCLPAANYAGGDVLVVRRLSTSPVAAPFSSSLIYFRSAYEGGQAFIGPTAPDFTSTNRQPPYLDYLLEEAVYYISPYTNDPGESPRIPALYRLRLTNGPAMVPELVASGVENMQIRFGQFDIDKTSRYLDASSISDWDSVQSVQLWLLLRSTAPEPGYKNTSNYNMGDRSITVNDGYRRLVFSAVVQLRN